ncbi:MAG: hypothetical protein OXI56_05880 [bacterium]|nr:hypothetical protein [bacterium]MDE0601307.1 hypothetical protein [bacterium]
MQLRPMQVLRVHCLRERRGGAQLLHRFCVRLLLQVGLLLRIAVPTAGFNHQQRHLRK